MTDFAYRVAHYGTGDTGAQALRGVLARPGLELVAHLVHSPEKLGRDSGEIVGQGPVGIRAIDDFEAFLAVDADCVTYFPTDFGREPDDVINEMCAILASGKNVVTSTMPVLVYPPALPRDVKDRLEAACSAGNTSFFCSGIAPGYTTDAFVLSCSSLCDRVTSVQVLERIVMSTYRDPMVFTFMGFGQAPDALDAQELTPGNSTWPSVPMLADGLGMQLESTRARRDVALADKDYTCAAGSIPAGTVGTVRLTFEGIVKDEPVLTIALTYSMIDTVVDDWLPRVADDAPRDARTNQVISTGSPHLDSRLVLSGSDQPGVNATAARVLNAIPAACHASAGLHSPLTIPVWGDHAFTP